MTAPCPDCAADCGCRVDDEPERAELGVGAHPGAELSPSGYPSDPPALNGPQNRAERCEPVDVTEEEMREFIVACDGPQGVSDEEAAEWERLAAGATEGPWVVDQDGSIGAPMAGLVCGEAGHPRPDCSECGTRVCHTSVMPGEPDAAFIAAARTAVPRLLAEREALRADHAALLALHEVEVARRESAEARVTRLTADLDAMEAEDSREDVRAKHWTEVLRVRRELAGVRCENNDAMEVIARGLGYSPSDFPLDRWPHLAMTGDHTPVSLAEEVVGRLDQARSFAARVEAENARLREGIERMCSDIDNPLVERRDESPHDLPEVAEDLRALLADTDSAHPARATRPGACGVPVMTRCPSCGATVRSLTREAGGRWSLGCGDWITDEQAAPILAARGDDT